MAKDTWLLFFDKIRRRFKPCDAQHGTAKAKKDGGCRGAVRECSANVNGRKIGMEIPYKDL
jgi:hypothetical protein